jgi:hypothetical protein
MRPGGPPLGARIVVVEHNESPRPLRPPRLAGGRLAESRPPPRAPFVGMILNRTIDQRDRGPTIQAAAQLMFEGIAK